MTGTVVHAQELKPPSAGAHVVRPVWRSDLLAAGVVGAGLLIGLAPLLHKFLFDLRGREQYSFFPLILLAAAALAVERLRALPAAAVRRGTWGVAGPVLAASLGLAVLGAVFYMRWFAAPAAWLALAAVAWRLGGAAVAKALLPAGVLLLVVIPPPFHLDTDLTQGLQRIAVRASGSLLDTLHVPHLRTGTVIEIPGHRLMVEEACSGINSLLSVIAFTLLYGFLKRRSASVIALLAAAAVWFVVCANVARITGGAFAQARYGVNLLDGSAHTFSGLVLFAVCLGLVISTDRLIRLLVGGRVRKGRTAYASGDSPVTNRGVSSVSFPAGAQFTRPGWRWWAFAAAFTAVGVFTHLRVRDCWPVSRLPGAVLLTPPARVGEWELVASGTTYVERTESFAKYSHRWRYRRGGVTAEVALAYPFTTGYHDPAVCYTSAGWSLTGRGASAERDPAAGDAAEPRDGSRASPHFDFHMTKLSTTHGYLLFGAFDEQGRWQAPPSEAAPPGALAYRIWLSKRVAELSPTHEVQTLVVSSDPMDDGVRRQAEQLFLAVRTALVQQAVHHLAGGLAEDAP